MSLKRFTYTPITNANIRIEKKIDWNYMGLVGLVVGNIIIIINIVFWN